MNHEPQSTTTETIPSGVAGVEQSVSRIRIATNRLGRLARGLKGTVERPECATLAHAEDLLSAIRQHAAALERRAGIEAVMTPLHGEAPSNSRGEFCSLLVGQAMSLTDAAERAFALDMPEAALYLYDVTLDVLSRAVLEKGAPTADLSAPATSHH